jgi:mRNA interferase RelE/StbE
MLDRMDFMSYSVNMVRYIDAISKKVKKGKIPKEIFQHINNAFGSLDLTKDLNLLESTEF